MKILILDDKYTKSNLLSLNRKHMEYYFNIGIEDIFTKTLHKDECEIAIKFEDKNLVCKLRTSNNN